MMRHIPNDAERAAAKRVADRYLPAPRARSSRRREPDADIKTKSTRCAINRQDVLEMLRLVEDDLKARKIGPAKRQLLLLRRMIWDA